MSGKRARPGQRVQLHRAVSKLGWGSRTQAWDWIRAGQVLVDGRVVTDPLTWIDLDHQRITSARQPVTTTVPLTLALHKPRGIVTTRSDERGRRTVYDLLPPGLPWVFPAGRLDADSEGLLILTNDGPLADRLTSPEHHIPRTYHVTMAGSVTEEVVARLRQGVELADGRTRPAEVRVLKRCAKATVLEMVLREGRNRQIRRMGAAVGHRVRRLVRVAIGAYGLGELAPGACQILDAAALDLLLDCGAGRRGREDSP